MKDLIGIDGIPQTISGWISKLTGLPSQLVINTINTLIVFLILWLLSKLAYKILKKSIDDQKTLYRWRKNTNYVFYAIAFIFLMNIWVFEIGSLATYLGLLSAGIAVALKDPITSLFAWLFILWRKPFQTGDRIQIGQIAGDVIDIRIFSFKLIEIGNWVDADQTTGRTITIPNARIFISEMANYSSDFDYIWIELPVLVTFESDWKKAKQILEAIAEKNGKKFTELAKKEISQASERFLLPNEEVEPRVFTTVKDSGVMLTMRFVVNPRNRRAFEQEIWEKILDEFAKYNNIDFAYPTQRFYTNYNEGKPGTRPE